jgi:ABC-type sugar transport system substrate-binding protein
VRRRWKVFGTAVLAVCVILAAATVAGASKQQHRKQITIGLAHYALVIPFYRSMTAGFQASAKKYGWKVVVTDSNFDPSKQTANIESLIAQHVDAIVASPGDANALIPAYKEAHAAGIPIFSIANNVAPSGYKYESGFYGSNQAGISSQRTLFLAKQMHGKGDVIAIRGPSPVYFVVQDKIGYDRVMKKYPNIHTVFEQNSKDITPEEGLRLAQDAFTAHPNVQGVWIETDDLAVGVVQVMKSRGLTGKIPVVSMDGSPQAFDLIKKGDLTYTLALPTYLWAQQMSALLRNYLVNHKPFPKSIIGPTFGVTKANVAKYAAQCKQRPQEVWCPGKK